MKKLLSTLFVLALFGAAMPAMAQFNWPADEAKAQLAREKYSLFQDSRKMGDVNMAKSAFTWLITNTPDLTRSIYISGTGFYEEMADAEKDPKRKIELQDSALWLYDQRIKLFGDEANVLNRKLGVAYRYYLERQDKMLDLAKEYEQLFKIASPVEITETHLLTYFDAIRRNQKQNNANYTDDYLLELHEMLIGVMDQKISAGQDGALLQEIKTQLDAILADLVTIDCNFIEKQLAPQFLADPTNLELAKKIFAYSFQSKCTDTEIFLKAAKFYYSKEPQSGVAKLLGYRAISDENYDEGLKYIQDAIKMTEDNSEQAELTIRMADIASRRGQKSNARDLYLRAAQLDPSMREAYSKIGDLYAGSWDQCRGRTSMVEDRCIFIAAFEMYQRAGNNARMAEMRAQFPSAEEIFTEGKQVGEEVKVGCWINTTVKIVRRE
jgi:tetratricopeptide (TPR) repeat protein